MAEITASEMGRRGAASLNRKLTPEQRSQSARRAALARWAKTPTSARRSKKKQAVA